MSRDKERLALSLDVGGTKILAALVSHPGHVLCEKLSPTMADGGVEAVVDRMVTLVSDTLDEGGVDISHVEGMGIAVAGAIDTNAGIVTASPNLPNWRDVPLVNILADRFKTAVYVVNDASAAALAEHLRGAGRGTSNMVYLTVSTGIGGGIVIDGELYIGTDGCAGEIGHMVIDSHGPRCNCGNDGCLEALASGTAVAREAVRRLKRGEQSQLLELVEGKLEDIDARVVGIAASVGDSLALDIITRGSRYLGLGMVNLVNIFNPERIVVGGGLSHMGEMLLGPARQVVREKAFKLPAQSVSIVTSELGDEAGVIGAAMFVFQACDKGFPYS